MSRMDRYLDLESQTEEPKLSRTEKNSRMYEDVYFNTSVVDIDNYLNNEHNSDLENREETIVSTSKEIYEEKNYSIDDYLEKAREKRTDDDALRDLNNNDFQDREDEISKLIASIDEKEDNVDIFEELRGDNENTLVKGMKTDEFNQDIYKTLAEEEIFSNTSVTSLEKALGDKTVFDLAQEEDDKLDHTFEKIMESDRVMAKKQKKLPIVVFSITLFMLIIAIILVLIFK